MISSVAVSSSSTSLSLLSKVDQLLGLTPLLVDNQFLRSSIQHFFGFPLCLLVMDSTV